MIVADTSFLGANFSLNPKKLASGIGVSAIDLDSSQGDFRGRRAASSVHTLVGYGATQQQALYRMGRETADDTQYWLAYVVPTDFARSMLANDPTERTYGTIPGIIEPSFTDNTFLAAPPYPNGYYRLGIPLPGGGMTAVVATAGTGSNETRTYVSTFVRYNDDESGPSQPTKMVCGKGSTVTLASFPGLPIDGIAANVTKRRFYVSTGGDFELCAETTIGSTSVVDMGSRGAILQTGGAKSKPTWLEPPDDMQGLLELWSGMHGAYHGKQYLTCHPYNPHAWPVEYRRQIPDTVVGSAKWGQNWLLATTGIPRVVMGTTPLAMVDTPIYFMEACLSKRSVVGVGHGVCWASSRGLCYHGQLGTKVLTEGVFTEAQWLALHPETIIAACWGRWYLGFYDDGVSRKGFMVDTAKPDSVILVNQGCYALWSDPLSNRLYLLDSGNVIKKWDAGSVASASVKSRVIRHPMATTPGAARIVATTYPVTFSFWADGVLKSNAVTISNDNPFRLPGGYAAEEFQYQIDGTGPVEGVFIGEEMSDLP